MKTIKDFGVDYKERVEKAISCLQAGKGILLVDDENRENEGDIIYSAEKMTVKDMALMIRECSGIVCLCLTSQGKRIRKYRDNQEVSKIKEKPSERRKKSSLLLEKVRNSCLKIKHLWMNLHSLKFISFHVVSKISVRVIIFFIHQPVLYSWLLLVYCVVLQAGKKSSLFAKIRKRC